MISAEVRAALAEGRPWEAWFNRDETGHITAAGIDVNGRHAGIAEIKVLIENVDFDDAVEVDQLIEADTYLMASAPDLLEACKDALTITAWSPRIRARLAAAVAKADNKPPPPSQHVTLYLPGGKMNFDNYAAALAVIRLETKAVTIKRWADDTGKYEDFRNEAGGVVAQLWMENYPPEQEGFIYVNRQEAT